MFDEILVPLDGSPLAENALPHVVSIARTFGSRVTLLHVLEQDPGMQSRIAVDPLAWQMRKSEATAYIDQMQSRLREVGLRADQAIVEGRAEDQIIEYAHSHRVDLVALSSHGRGGLSRWNLSGVVQKVISRVYVPILLVRAYQPVTSSLTGLHYDRVMVPLDGSPRAEATLPVVDAVARAQESTLLLVYVVARPEVPRRVPLTEEETSLIQQFIEMSQRDGAEYLEELKSWLSANAETRLLVAQHVAAELHQLAERERVDLVALNAHGYSTELEWPYGSMALNFLSYGTTPLLIVQDVPQEWMATTEAEAAVRERPGH